jgi:hypothetical protein
MIIGQDERQIYTHVGGACVSRLKQHRKGNASVSFSMRWW